MSNDSPLFSHGSPFTLGQRRRMLARMQADWLAQNRGRVVVGDLIPDYVKPFPAGWALEDGVSLNNGGRLYVLRYREPRPPLLPRYRVSEKNGWRTATDKDLLIFGDKPADYQPAPAAPGSALTRLKNWFNSL